MPAGLYHCSLKQSRSIIHCVTTQQALQLALANTVLYIMRTINKHWQRQQPFLFLPGFSVNPSYLQLLRDPSPPAHHWSFQNMYFFCMDFVCVMSSEWIVVISHRLTVELLIFLKAFRNKIQEMVFVTLRYLWRRRSNWPLCPWERQLDWEHLTSLRWVINHGSDSDTEGQSTTLSRRSSFEHKRGICGDISKFPLFFHDLTEFSKPFLSEAWPFTHYLPGRYSGHTGDQLLPVTELFTEV